MRDALLLVYVGLMKAIVNQTINACLVWHVDMTTAILNLAMRTEQTVAMIPALVLLTWNQECSFPPIIPIVTRIICNVQALSQFNKERLLQLNSTRLM